jgi:hypothetical protein
MLVKLFISHANIASGSRSGYYEWLKRPMKPNIDELGSRIMGIFHKSEGIYGVRRVKSVLSSQGIRVTPKNNRGVQDCV